MIELEFTIKKIISIDNDAESYKKNMNELLLKERKKLKDDIKNMEDEAEKNLSEKKKEILSSKIQDAEDAVKKIKKENSETIKKMQDVFENQKSIIVSEAFRKIISCRMEA